MALTIDGKLCPQDHICPLLTICPINAISQEGYGLPSIDADKCIECEKCIRFCGKKAVYKKI